MVLVSPAPSPRLLWLRRRADSIGPSALTLILASTVLVLGWAGVDQAAQTYRTLQYQLHGFMLWDSGWYAGNFPLGYSVLFPVVAGTFGIKIVAVASAVMATWSFDRVIRTYFGSRPLGTWYFAISMLLPVTIGQWPFLAGEAAGLLSLLSLQKGRRSLALALGVLSALFSPLAAAFLAMGYLAWAAYSNRRWWMVATAAVSLIVVLILGVLFPGTGPFPFPWTGLVPTELLCLSVMTPLVRTTPAVRLGALFYASSSLFSFIVPNPLGGNAPRLAASVGIPLLACFLTVPGPAHDRVSLSGLLQRSTHKTRWRRWTLPDRWRYAAVLLVVPFAVWQWAPWDGVVTSPQAARYTQASFYQPLLATLAAQSANPVRVEIPPTSDHWESAFVAPYVSLARGWERQLDIVDNPLFYTKGALAGTLNAAAYTTWLDAEGIGYVALPSAPLDYAAKAEGALLDSGRVPGLRLVWSSPDWKLWQVVSSPGLVSGPATLTALEPDHLTLQAHAAGTIIVRVRWTNFWSVTTANACVSPAPTPGAPLASGESGHDPAAPPYQWTSVKALSAGTISLSASVLHPTAPASCPSS